MRRLAVLLIVACAPLALTGLGWGQLNPRSIAQRASAEDCGGIARWDVKTLSDPGRSQVEFFPKWTTVHKLVTKTRPDQPIGKDTPRITGVETTTYRLKARLVEAKLIFGSASKPGDHDIHLVIANPNDPAETMVVEFPDTTCRGASSSPKGEQMAAARDAYTAACGGLPSKSKFTMLSGTATITGVGFFDFPHATGAADTGIELHPVLKFRSDDCQRTP